MSTLKKKNYNGRRTITYLCYGSTAIFKFNISNKAERANYDIYDVVKLNKTVFGLHDLCKDFSAVKFSGSGFKGLSRDA